MIAPLKCIDAVEAALTLPFAEGLKRERELFMELMASEQSRALRHVFFAERQAAKVPGLAPDAKPKEIRLAAVIGAGTMGGGIAMTFANAGIPVKVMETSQDTLDRGLGVIKGNYRSSVSKGRLSAERAAERMGLIEGVLGYQATSEADIVVEAVFEDLDLKGQVFRALDGVLKPGAILATNTSTLDVDAIAAVTSRPEAVVGTHFFSPANVMKLLEIVRAAKTSDETLQTATLLAKTLGKVPVVVGVCDGFVGNRMVHKYLREAFFLIEDGALPQQVDRVMTGFGLAMGPFAMSDLAGLDVGYRIRQAQAAKRPAYERYSSVADKLVEQGRLGQKTGAGFYRYEPGNRTPLPDPEVERLILEHSRRLGIRRRDFSDEEILKHLMYALVNEGAKILAEGVARRAGDIDVIYVYGYGFPAHRGGPMFYASRTGLDEVYANINRFHQEYGDIWKPAPLLAALAQEGKTFTDYDDERR
jgi:3-hydroxyacyl-CoA dehydrogenase